MRLLLIHNHLLHNLRSILQLVRNTLSRSRCLLRHITLDLIALIRRPRVHSVCTALLDELSQVLNSASTRESDGRVLLAGSVQLDSRESLDLIGDIVERSVDLGNSNFIRESLVQLSQLVVLRGKRLAVSAPWSVELNEHILLVIEHNLIVVLSHDNRDGSILLLGDSLRLDARVDLASDKVVDELADVLVGDLLGLVVGELLVLDCLLDGEGGPLSRLEVEVATMLAEGLGVDDGEVDLALVLLGDGLEVLGDGVALLGGLSEDVGEGKTGLVIN